MTLLVDFGDAPDSCCNLAFDTLFKALAEEPAGADSLLWEPHANPWIAEHVEAFTTEYQAILTAMQDAMLRLLVDSHGAELRKAQGDLPWLRMDAEALEEARARLDAKPKWQWTIDDWLEASTLIIQTYLPPGVIRRMADWVTVKAALLGKLQGALSGQQRVAAPQIRALDVLLPTELATVPDAILAPREYQMIAYARAHAAENISAVTNQARHRMNSLILQHVQAQVLGQTGGDHRALKQRLFDEFGSLNRDMRRIAVTEAGEACNQGYIAALTPGRRVQRNAAYRGACDFCRSLNGKIFKVIDPADVVPSRDGDTSVWTGKTNIGRSASPRMREGGHLVERPKSEMWWPAAGVNHPNCRCSWSVAVDESTPPGVSKEFDAYLKNLLTQGRPAPPLSDQDE